ALHQPRAVVHPRVVAAQLAAADERQVVAVGQRVLALARVLGELRRLLDEHRRRELHALVSRVERARQSRLERAQVDAVLGALYLRDTQALARAAPQDAVRPERDP